MSRTKELFMNMREEQAQFEASIQEQEYFNSININNQIQISK
jgi:hypothetical protein